MDQKELESIKSELRSILVSTKCDSTVEVLAREYRAFMGHRIQFEKWGFKTLVDFLKSMPDTILIRGNTQSAGVSLIVNEKIQHINDLVNSQKSSKKRTVLRPFKPYRQYQQYSHSYHRRRYDNSSYHVSGMLREKQTRYFQSSNNVHPRRDFSLSITQPQTYWETPLKKPGTDSLFKKERREEQFESKENISANSQNMTQNLKQIKNDLFDVPVKVKQNLKTLIGYYTKGIVVSELSKLYKQQFGTDLNYEYMGFTSAVELCTELSDMFHCVRPSKHSSCMIFDASKRIPEETLSFYRKKGEEDNFVPPLQTNLCSPVKADILLDMQHLKDFYRSDCLGPSDKISTISLPFKVNGLYNITVSETYDPHKFWFQHNHDDFYVILNKIMDDMGHFYYEKSKNYTIPTGALKPGLYCAALFLHSYHRARITEVLPSGKVKLYYCDYGTVNVMEANMLCFLHRDFAKLPQQAFRGRLDYVVPFGLKYWTLGIASYFVNLTQQKNLIALVTEVDSKDGVFGMILYDPEDKMYINQNLVAKGMAVKQCPNPEALYRHPKFQFIEDGVVYSHVDLLRMQGTGYQHVDILCNDLKNQITKYNSDKKKDDFIIVDYLPYPKLYFEAQSDEEMSFVHTTQYSDAETAVDPYYHNSDVLSFEGNGNNSMQKSIADNGTMDHKENTYDDIMDEISDIEEIRFHVNVILFGKHKFHIVYHNGGLYVILAEVVDKLTDFNSVDEMEEVLKEKKVYFNYLILNGEKDYDILREIAEFRIKCMIPIIPQNIVTYKLKVLKLEALTILLYSLGLEYKGIQNWVDDCLQAVNEATENDS